MPEADTDSGIFRLVQKQNGSQIPLESIKIQADLQGFTATVVASLKYTTNNEEGPIEVISNGAYFAHHVLKTFFARRHFYQVHQVLFLAVCSTQENFMTSGPNSSFEFSLLVYMMVTLMRNTVLTMLQQNQLTPA